MRAPAWYVVERPNPQARLRLLCFPYAGGGASVYRAWSAEQPDWLEINGAVLPGRDRMFGVPACWSLEELVPLLVEGVRPLLDNGPFALFGHSLGALVAYELCRALRRDGLPGPAALVVCSRRAPHVPGPDGRLYDRPDDELVDRLRWYGAPAQMLAHPARLKLFLPTLRADFSIEDTYRYRAETPLRLPLIAYGGDHDPGASTEGVRAWDTHTEGEFRHRVFPGGHFFVQEVPDVFGRVTEDLAELVGAASMMIGEQK